jgi:hypothetical protein
MNTRILPGFQRFSGGEWGHPHRRRSIQIRDSQGPLDRRFAFPGTVGGESLQDEEAGPSLAWD